MVVLAFFLSVVVPVLAVILSTFTTADFVQLVDSLRAAENRVRRVTPRTAMILVLFFFATIAAFYWLSALGYWVISTPSRQSNEVQVVNTVSPVDDIRGADQSQPSKEVELRQIADNEFQRRTSHIISALQNRETTEFKALSLEDKRRILEEQFFAAHLLHGRPGNSFRQNESVLDYERFLRRLADAEGFSGRAMSTVELEKLKSLRRDNPFFKL